MADVEALREAFMRRFGREPTVISEAPGRVNLIGEHTDYNQGVVLPVAIDRTVAVAAARGGRGTVRVYSADFDARDEWRADAPRRTGRREWRDYVRGVAWALLDAGHALSGADLAIAGDVPQGAGLASSAALEVAVAGAMCNLSNVIVEPQPLALLCRKAENQFVGVQCGVMDQLASSCSHAGHALLIDCRSLEITHVPLPDGVTIVIVDSRVPRALGDTAYNERRAECARAERLLEIDALVDVTPEDLESDRPHLTEELYRRVRHVATENRRVLAAVPALRAGDLERLGNLMYESHASLRDDFGVSTPELDLLVDLASQMQDVLGARLTGAGFGGCTVHLLAEGAETRFESEVVERYRRETGLPAEMHVCRSVGGLEVRSA